MNPSLTRIINKLVERASFDSVLYCGSRKPGYFIESMSKEDREELQRAKSKDFSVRIEKDKLPIP